MKEKIKAIIASFLIVVLVFAAGAVPIESQAAVYSPNCVKVAAEKAMKESGLDVAFVVKLNGNNGKGTGYMMYRNRKGKVVCDRSGQVILGKDTPFYPEGNYYFYRNRNIEKKVMTWTKDGVKHRQYWSLNVENDKGAAFGFLFHSYVEKKVNGVWKAYKGTKSNRDGMAACKEFVHYLRSCADPGCRIIFIK